MSVTFDTDITIYSHWKKGRDEAWIRTQITGASWYGHQGANVGDSGLVTADQYVVRIRDWSTGAYVPPDTWNALEAKPDGVWTVRNGDVVVKGLVDDEPTGITQITNKYQDSFVVTGVFDNRRIALKHLRIEGK